MKVSSQYIELKASKVEKQPTAKIKTSHLKKNHDALRVERSFDKMQATAKLYETAIKRPYGVVMVQSFKAERRKAKRQAKRVK